MSEKFVFSSYPQHRPLIELVFRHGGYIWGGYVRDLIAGDSPHDIDVAISDDYVQEFYAELVSFGYEPGPDQHTWNHSGGLISIDVIENDSEAHDQQLIDIGAPIDFDVNCLAYDGQYLFFWTGSTTDPLEIVEAIQRRVATAVNPTPQRVTKMLGKGYTINPAPVSE